MDEHGLLLRISEAVARLEAKVDALVQRIDSIDRRLADHESRIRVLEVETVTTEEIATRDAADAVARRWLVGLLIGSGLTILAGIASIYF
jgi:hypothetical protein